MKMCADHWNVIQPVAAKVTEVNPLDTSTAPDSTKSHDTEPEDSGMDSRKPHSELVTLNDSRLSALAMRGPIQVYVAKYSYDPFEYSPNENPEAELPLSAGDYVLVLGDMDEDGFFEGELIDGRRGLVPSNFIERVAEDDLAEFHAALALSGGHNDSNNKLGHSPIDSDTEDMVGTNYDVMNGQHTKNILNNNNNNTYEPPHPQQLSLERQLTTSVLISWWPPDGLDPSAINAYHVYLDGVLKMTVKATERTKALLENVDANQNHRVSVRCLSNQGQSKDAQCTMLIGRDVLPVPSDLGVRSVTHDSATVTWLPGNSSCSHAILMNGREVKVVKPGVFHYTLTGLDPETVYRVTIATKPAPGTYGERHKWSQDKVSGNIEFKTPPKGRGVPDPPLNVQSPKVGATAEHTGHETDEEIEAAFQEAENSSPEIETNIAEPFEESSSSELSDIPEVEEEIGADEASQNGERSLAISQSQEKLRKSPKPAPRKVSPSAGQVEREPEFSPKQFHGQKPDPSRKDGLLTTPMIVPAIEITRDSSTERGTSFEEEIEPTGARKPTPPHDASGKPKHRQKSMEDSVEKPLPTQDPITQRYRSGTDEPSAFRSVEQGKARSSEDTRSPDSAKSRPDSAKSRPDSAKSHHRPGSSGSAKASPSHSAKEDKHADDRHLEDRHREDRHKEDRHREDRHREDRHREDRHREDRHADDRHREDRHADDRQREERHREDRHREDRHLDERHREDRHADDRHTEDRHGAHQEPVPPAKPARLTPAEYEESNDRDSISGEINSVVDDSMVRLFIALFDYDPVTMSPNVDAVDEELPFREGQILKVYGDKDADGFYRGEANGQLGYIPCNMVSEIHIDDPDLVEQLLKESQSNSTHHPNLPDDKTDKRGNHLTPNGLPPLPPSGPGRRMVALYDYDPQELSPNVDAEVELAFKQGDIVYVMGDMDEDGFFTGELHGISRKDRLSLSPPTERAIVLDTAPSSQTPPASTATPPTDDDKRGKKKGGLLNKGRNILKKFSR
nr:hypothetical protein BaRGS_005649 [Batillaria attramentaria]